MRTREGKKGGEKRKGMGGKRYDISRNQSEGRRRKEGGGGKEKKDSFASYPLKTQPKRKEKKKEKKRHKEETRQSRIS